MKHEMKLVIPEIPKQTNKKTLSVLIIVCVTTGARIITLGFLFISDLSDLVSSTKTNCLSLTLAWLAYWLI